MWFNLDFIIVIFVLPALISTKVSVFSSVREVKEMSIKIPGCSRSSCWTLCCRWMILPMEEMVRWCLCFCQTWRRWWDDGSWMLPLSSTFLGFLPSLDLSSGKIPYLFTPRLSLTQDPSTHVRASVATHVTFGIMGIPLIFETDFWCSVPIVSERQKGETRRRAGGQVKTKPIWFEFPWRHGLICLRWKTIAWVHSCGFESCDSTWFVWRGLGLVMGEPHVREHSQHLAASR